jgi:DNA-directed RNA polymerase subunit RPC12/RpoP
MAESTVIYRCPNCDAGLLFDADSQKFACEFCLSKFTEEELSATDSAEKAQKAEKENAEFAGSINEYNCPSCGAEIITDKSTIADFCYYCHNPIVLSDRVSGAIKPSKIIPFAFDREGAREAFIRAVKKKRFLPKDFKSAEHIEKIKGIYYPYWITDADTDASLEAYAHRIRKWRSGNYRYTETSKFKVFRDGFIHFEDIATSAMKTEDKKMLEGILPYPPDAYVDFSMPYLLGYSAKKRDVERAELSEEVRDRMHSYAEELLSDTVHGYNSVHHKKTGINIKSCHWEYSLLPIWVLNYIKKTKKKTKVYTYAMNGHTGKIYGEYPVSFPKLLVLFGILATSLTVICTLIGRFMI